MKVAAKADTGEPEDDEEADLRLYQRLSGEPMYLLWTIRLTAPFTEWACPSRSKTYWVNGPGPCIRQKIEWTGQRAIRSTGNPDLSLPNKFPRPPHRIVKPCDLFSITICHPHIRTRKCHLSFWPSRMELMSCLVVGRPIYSTPVPFTRQHVELMCLPQPLDKLSSKWARRRANDPERIHCAELAQTSCL